ncbi:MAG: hypothetical protein ACPKMZ_01880 [Pleomorphochaeta sp.]
MKSSLISMIKEIIRLKFEFNLSTHEIARRVEFSKSSVANILKICRIHELNYDSIAEALSNIDSGLRENFTDSKRIGEINRENIDIFQEL